MFNDIPVYRTDVVKAATGYITARGGVGTGHNPAGPEGDGVHLVGCVAVPHYQLSILRGRHQIPESKKRTCKIKS